MAQTEALNVHCDGQRSTVLLYFNLFSVSASVFRNKVMRILLAKHQLPFQRYHWSALAIQRLGTYESLLQI